MNKSPENLSTKAARGALLTLVGQVARTIIQTLGVLTLARLLTPSDFGLVAMVVAFAGFGEVIRELGLGLAAIQAKVLTIGQRDNLFWANTLLGCVIGILFFGLSWPLAGLYGDERLIAITQCVAITFVFSGMAAQYRAGLQRELKFAGVVIADVVSMLCGVAAAIILALLGWGYWSIVCQQVTQPIVGLVIVMAASRWIPGRMRRGQGMRTFISSGWNIFAYQMLTYASRNIDTVLVGIRFGPTSAGYYSRAFQLMTVPLGQFLTPSVRIAVSVLSRLQDDKAAFVRYLQRAQDAVLFVSLSVLALLYGMATPVVDILLGPNWHEVVPIFQTLAVAGIFQALSYPPLWAFFALGHARANLLQATLARCVLIAAVFLGSFFGVQGIAIGYAGGMALAWPIAMFALARVSQFRVTSLVWAACRHVLVFVIGGVLVSQVEVFFDHVPSIMNVALGLAVLVIYLSMIALIWPAIRRDAVDAFRAFLRLRSAKALG